MQTKNTLRFILCLLIFFVLVSCSSSQSSAGSSSSQFAAERTLLNFFEALAEDNSEKALQYLESREVVGQMLFCFFPDKNYDIDIIKETYLFSEFEIIERSIEWDGIESEYQRGTVELKRIRGKWLISKFNCPGP